MLKGLSVIKIFVKIRSSFPEKWAELWKHILSRSVEESFKKFLEFDPDAGDLQNLTSSFLFKVDFWKRIHEDSTSNFLREVATRQTERHIHNEEDKRRIKHNSLEEVINVA